MTRVNWLRLKLAIALAMGLLFVQPRPARAGEGSSPRQVNAIPVIESVTDTLAFISWSTQNPGGTILHYAVVHYGKDPNHLDLTAQSPTRINQAHKEMVFRVRVGDLQPQTTYYYKVSSKQADGIFDPATSGVNQFTTQPTNQMSAKK
ncbi:MAG: Purple acid Phosphatase, N-terminal domain [Acidobacteriaceae bacterium]